MNPTQKLIIRELLKQGCTTQKQLTAATRAAPTTIRDYMRKLLANQQVHIREAIDNAMQRQAAE